MMLPPLPLNAAEIFVEWATKEGGIGAIACTDDKGLPYIGLYPLNCIGKPNGLPIWMRRRRFMSEVTIGFKKPAPVVIFIDVSVNERGISLIVVVPTKNAEHHQRHTYAKWGSEAPRYGYIAFPANSNWPVSPFSEVSE